jgi:hypothetical protein
MTIEAWTREVSEDAIPAIEVALREAVQPMRRVFVESPYKARFFWQRWLNRRYARRCLKDALDRGEAPFASHLLYTQPGVLRDSDSVERDRGIRAGMAWGTVADATVVYTDRGVSAGMSLGITAAVLADRPVEYRSLSGGDHGPAA